MIGFVYAKSDLYQNIELFVDPELVFKAYKIYFIQ